MTGVAGRGQALTGSAMAWYSALPGRRRMLAQDAALALALALLNLLSLLPYQSQMHPLWLALFLVSAQCLPLAVRRLWPVPALICCGVPRNLYDALAFGFAPLPLGPAIAFATVAERSRWWLRWPTLGFTAVGLVVGQLTPGHTEPYDAIVQFFIFGAAWAVGTLSRVRRESMAAVSRRAERAEAELDAAASRAAAAERLRIARELHDVVAHHVSLMAVQAEAVGALLPSRPAEAARSADLIAATARQAMTELRRLLGVLRFNPPGFAPPGDDLLPHDQDQPPEERARLTPAPSITRLQDVLAVVREAGLPVAARVSGTPAALSPGVDLTAYRIVQEALTNALRHAPGSTACVDVAYEADCVTIRVTDTGPAPAVAASSAASALRSGGAAGSGAAGSGTAGSGTAGSGTAGSGTAGSGAAAGGGRGGGRLAPGYGLAGIAERVASCGGTLTLGPVAPGGFAVIARLPLT